MSFFKIIIFLFFISTFFCCNKIPELQDQDLFFTLPNPCKDKVFIYLRVLGEKEMTIRLLGVDGDEIFEDKVIPNHDQIEIDLSNEPDGILYLEIEYENQFIREKVIKVT